MALMNTQPGPIRRFFIAMIVMIIISVSIGGITYLAGTFGISRPPVRGIPVTPQTPMPDPAETPIARFFQIDPALLDFMDDRQPEYSLIIPAGLGIELQPVGAFLPRTGDRQVQLAGPTPLPTPLPYPTSPPLPLPFVPRTILPTVSPFTEDGTPRTLPYEAPASAECAPAGNPVNGILTQRYHVYHSGIDIAVPLGTPVLATHSGTVTFAGWSDVGYGYLVILQNGPFITYYAHNTSFNVSRGQRVGKGSIIAWSGSTGNSTGPHVHYETRINDIPVDPQTFGNRGYRTC